MKFRTSVRRPGRVLHKEPEATSDSTLPILVKQEFRDESNINNIFAKIKHTGQPPAWVNEKTPHYGDFSNLPTSLTQAYEIVSQAEAAFNSLPVEFRRAIDHDPANLDKAPRELYEQFGLLKAPLNERSGTPDASATAQPRGVRGDRDLPAKEPQGSKKGRQAAPVDEGDSES